MHSDPLSIKATLINSVRGQRGLYLWTHIASGKQYVGSSRDLGNRLADYFRPSYLHTQSARGSAISRALLTHGHAAFSLSIQILGPTLQGQVYSATNLPDYVVIEQEYLDMYVLAYNINRIASSAAYIPSTGRINVGVDNPAYGLTGTLSPVWGHSHSQVAKDLWSQARGKYTFFLYDSVTFVLLGIFPSAVKLAQFLLNVSKNFGVVVAKHLNTIGLPALRYGGYIISLIELTVDEIKHLLPDMPIKSISTTKGIGKTIYGFNPTTDTYRTWISLEKCTHELTGKQFENKATINRRIDKGIIFHGYLLQTKSFK